MGRQSQEGRGAPGTLVLQRAVPGLSSALVMQQRTQLVIGGVQTRHRKERTAQTAVRECSGNAGEKPGRRHNIAPQTTEVNKTSATWCQQGCGVRRADMAACSESRPGRKLRPRKSCNRRQSQGNPHHRQAMSLERPQAQVSGTRLHRSLRPGWWAQAARPRRLGKQLRGRTAGMSSPTQVMASRGPRLRTQPHT